MKRMIFISLSVVLLSTIGWSQEKIEAPIFNVGSKWTFKADNGWQWTSETIGEDKDNYCQLTVLTEGMRKGEWKRFYSKKNMNCVKVIRDGKEDKENRDMIKKLYDFPLYPGKKWTYRYSFIPEASRREIDMLVELSAIGFEPIDIQGSKFKTIKVKCQQSVVGKGDSGVYYYWYSPEAKIAVKTEWEPSGFWRALEYNRFELISFELK